MDEKIRRAIKEYGMISPNDRVTVGFSGGADSVALLHHLYTFRSEYGIEVSAVHIHHMIRGEEADRDLNFCDSFCRKRDIPFYSEKVNVPLISEERGTGLEQTGREERGRVFSRLCDEGTDRIALAHHADDNLETAIFNLIRGTGPRGIAGIPPVRGYIIRPLIYCTKSEIIGYCRANCLDFVTDSTNAENDCTRNLIRNKVVPVLKEINPSAAETVLRTASLIRTDEDYFAARISEIPENASREYLSSLDDAVLSRFLISKIKAETGTSPETVHISGCMKNLRCGKEYRESDLPGGYTAVFDRNTFFIRKKADKGYPIGKNHEKILKIQPGIAEYSLDNHTGGIIISDKKDFIKKAAEEYGISEDHIVRIDRFCGELYLRTRNEGDTVRSRNMTKRLKELLRASDIPSETREKLPMLCDGRGILWVPGVVRADRPETDKRDKPTFAAYTGSY